MSFHKVMARRCGECLFGKNRIVRPGRAAEIIKETARRDVPFICHRASIAKQEITCHGSWETTGGGQLGRIASRLGAVSFIDPETLHPVKESA